MGLSAGSGGGGREDDRGEIGERLSRQKLAARVYPDARELVAAHQRRGHTVALVSSATRHQVEPIAPSRERSRPAPGSTSAFMQAAT